MVTYKRVYYISAMSTVITSNIIGQLQQDPQFPEWWKSAPVDIPFFDNKKLTITYVGFEPDQDRSFIADADQAIANFLQLTATNRKAITSLAYKNCTDFLEAVEYDEEDAPFTQLNDPHEIWNFIYPNEVFVSRRNRRDQDMYVQIDCECEWEQEHGLQLVFRQGKKLTRISSIDGHVTEADAYDKPDEEDELLSKFHEPGF